MKVGDSVPVTLAGHVVAQATVKEVGEGQAVLIVPATQVTMAVRVELDAAPTPERETETIISGVERVSEDTAPVETPAPEAPETAAPATEVSSGDSATVVETTGAPEVVVSESTEPAVPVEAPPVVDNSDV